MTELTPTDVIILIAKDSPCLYDKSYESSLNIKVEKKQVYETMSEAIQMNCLIEMTGNSFLCIFF